MLLKVCLHQEWQVVWIWNSLLLRYDPTLIKSRVCGQVTRWPFTAKSGKTWLTYPFSPLLINFCTSFTPRRMFFTLAAGMTERTMNTLFQTSIKHRSVLVNTTISIHPKFLPQNYSNLAHTTSWHINIIKKHGCFCLWLQPGGGGDISHPNEVNGLSMIIITIINNQFRLKDESRINHKSSTIRKRSHLMTFDLCHPC